MSTETTNALDALDRYLKRLERIAETADDLEYWLGRYAGYNADWPIKISGDREHINKLCSLLTDLQEALMPHRRSSGKLTLRAPMNPGEEATP